MYFGLLASCSPALHGLPWPSSHRSVLAFLTAHRSWLTRPGLADLSLRLWTPFRVIASASA